MAHGGAWGLHKLVSEALGEISEALTLLVFLSFQHAVLGQWCLAQQQSADTESDTSTCHFILFLGRVTFCFSFSVFFSFMVVVVVVVVVVPTSEGRRDHLEEKVEKLGFVTSFRSTVKRSKICKTTATTTRTVLKQRDIVHCY